MKAASPIKVIENKNLCFRLFLDLTRTLVLLPYFLRVLSGAQGKLFTQKIRCDELNLSRLANEFFQNVQNVQKCSEMPVFLGAGKPPVVNK